MYPGHHRHARASALVRRVVLASCVALGAGCGDSHPAAPRGPQGPLSVPDIDLLRIFVRAWPGEDSNEYVQVEFHRIDGRGMLILYRPAQPATGTWPAQPRLLLDSIGPQDGVPAEIVEIVNTWDVWAMTDSNAAGGACSTKTGQWACNITARDYSLVMGVGTGGTRQSQRYTGLETSTGNRAARALGDFVFAWSRRHGGGPISRYSREAVARVSAGSSNPRAPRAVHPVRRPREARSVPPAAIAAGARRP